MSQHATNHSERTPPPGVDLLGLAAIVERCQEAESIGECALADLTNLPRLGLRGKTAAARLAAEGFPIPEAPNRLTRAPTGETLLRLSQNEYLLLGAFADRGARVRALENELPKAGENGLYFLPRQDSHAWFWLGGPRRADVMAKLCGVDLSPEAFPLDALAQTSVARINAIAAHDGEPEPGAGAFHLLFDRPSAAYFQEALLDAMREFGGEFVGFATVRESAEK
jgi:sarcosine oxidase subunit gamma